VKAGRQLLALWAVLGAGALTAPSAHAGSYDVLSCSIDGGFARNGAWVAQNNPAGNNAYRTDTSCPSAGNPLSASLASGNSFAPATYAALWFTAPPQSAITDYKVAVHHYWYAPGPPDETTYELVSFGPTFFSGAGQFDRKRWQEPLALEGHWYGWVGDVPNGPVDATDTGVVTRTLSDSKIARGQGSATYMTVSAGCWAGSGGCTLGATANVFLELYGSRVTITDDTVPALTGPATDGLRAPGTRSGDEPLTFNATDNVGLRRAEIVDVTDAANPHVVASEDYATTQTAQKTRCDFTKPRPCPDLKNETIAASPAIAGKRTLLLRVTDAAGNQTVSLPFAITARGPVNGSGGGDGARLVAGFPGHAIRGRGKSRHRVGVLRPVKTVGWGHGALVRGILRNAARQPVGGADLRLLVRELKLGSRYTDRGGVTTASDGRFSIKITRGASRRFRIAYRAYAGDERLAAKSDVTLKTKARITLRAPRRVGSRGTARFRGRLPGHPLPPRGVTLELQAYQPGRGWRTVKTTRTGKGGVYSTRYHFNSAGGRFTFRVRLRPNDSYPYARAASKHVRVRVG
jgi:hypothetical protein